MIVTGDPTQIDLPRGEKSGLVEATALLDGIEGVHISRFNDKDVVRHALVGRIVRAYEADTARRLEAADRPRELEGRPAYWRLFHVFGNLWWCWWDCFTDRYSEATPEEIDRFGLQPLGRGMEKLAALTSMNFFSSEIAQTATGEFVWIDYVNDQCHMLTQSANPRMGVPDRVVEAIANRLVEAAARLIRRPEALAA